MLAMGKWLHVNGEAIYGTHAGPFPEEHGAYSATKKDKRGNPMWITVWDWRATAKGDKVYVSIFQWPDSTFSLPTMDAHVRRAYMLADPHQKALQVSQNESGIRLTLPAAAPDPIASVLVLETSA